MGSQELPLFSLRTKDVADCFWKSVDGETSLSVRPNSTGRATQFDYDILIYCISALIHAKNKRLPLSQVVAFKVIDFFNATSSSHGGKNYLLFRQALDRLQGTVFKTNYKQGGFIITNSFSLISGYKSVEVSSGGVVLVVEVTLSEWIFNTLLADRPHVKTINRKYFELRKAIERRLYLIALKKVGLQGVWEIGIDALHKRLGSAQASRPHFLQSLKQIIIDDRIPDFRIQIIGEKVRFYAYDPNSIVKKFS